MAEPLALFAASAAALTGLSVRLGLDRPRTATLPWVALCALGLALAWSRPGLRAALFTVCLCIYAVRALDASQSSPGLSRAAFWRYVIDPTRTPERIELPARATSLKRGVRGVVLLGACFGVMKLGAHLQLWRTYPYLDDLLVLVEIGLVFTALTDLLVGTVWLWGDPVGDPHDASFPFSSSLSDFWACRWNRSFAGSLTRAIYIPSGGRQRRVRAVLLTFGVSGLVHAFPNLVAFPDRRQALIAGGTALLFFMLHALAVLLEGALLGGERRGRGGRLVLWTTWAITAPLYVPVTAVAVGLHGRPFESLTFLPALDKLLGG